MLLRSIVKVRLSIMMEKPIMVKRFWNKLKQPFMNSLNYTKIRKS